MPGEREKRPAHELDRDVALAYAATFIPRYDQYPLQLGNGTYIAIKQTLYPDLIVAHLRGFITIGAYALNSESRANWICLDADKSDQWEKLQHVSLSLSKRAVPSYLEPSRRGGHLWLFVPSLTGTDARRFGKQLVTNYRIGPIEIYPKQDRLRTGAGSFVRFPLGVHRLTGHRYHFITPTGQPLAPTIREQIALLANPQRVPQSYITQVLARAAETPAQPPTPPFQPRKEGARKRRSLTGPPSERIKASLSVRDFVGQYVELDANGRGHCPFHEDEHQSFQVSDEGNFWNCYAGCGGGSLIDFWMKWRETQGEDGSFKATISDLAQMLLK